MNTSALAAARRRGLHSSIRALLIVLVVLLAVAAAFAAGIGIYAAAPVWQPLLLAWWPGLAFGAAIIVFPGAWWLWWRLPRRQVDRLRHAIRDPKARSDVEDNFRKTIGQLFGGAALLIGAGFAYVQFQQQQTSAHDLLISNQVSKGFELLGNKDGQIGQRLGGIYALEGVMNGSEQYQQPVLEALCAFVRDYTKNKTDDAPPATDVQAALTVIGRRKARNGRIDAELSNAHIPKAALNAADLSGAHLNAADLSGANMFGVNLSGAHLSNAFALGANLRSAGLGGANLRGIYLMGADLSGASMGEMILKRDYGIEQHEANLSGADLRTAKNLTQDQLDHACGDEDTKLDPPLTIKPCPKQ